ncbi:MAG: peptide chain release factor N(5)-glutamine methyltransferase [bacterium]
MRVKECFKNLRGEFKGISEEDFEHIFNRTLGIEYGLGYFSENKIKAAERRKLLNNLKLRHAGAPVEYILGQAEFFGMIFDIEDGIFIPKNSTETLLEKILDVTGGASSLLDIGCGCGVIAVSVSLLANLEALAVDIDARALEITKRNADKLGARVITVKSDIFENVSGKFDIIASNPPYVASLEKLDRDVLRQRPQSLFAGAEGLDCIRSIVLQAGDYLKPRGRLFLEIGYDQNAPVRKLLEDCGYADIKFYNDLAGIPRVAEAQDGK